VEEAWSFILDLEGGEGWVDVEAHKYAHLFTMFFYTEKYYKHHQKNTFFVYERKSFLLTGTFTEIGCWPG
jgi:hypothetical protein